MTVLPENMPIYQGFFFKDFTYLFLESREGREKEGERKIDVRETSISCLPYDWDQTHNPGMCPDWELN